MYMHRMLKNIKKYGEIFYTTSFSQNVKCVLYNYVCIFQGGRNKEQHIVVREDPPGPSGSQEGEVEEEEGMVVERVESGKASYRDSAAGEHVHGSHVYSSSHVKF